MKVVLLALALTLSLALATEEAVSSYSDYEDMGDSIDVDSLLSDDDLDLDYKDTTVIPDFYRTAPLGAAPTISDEDEDVQISGIPAALSQTQKDQILAFHNQVRAQVSPVANPALPPLVWDEKLATVAVNYANKCVYAHNANRNKDYGANVGENIAAWTNPAVDLTYGARLWRDEVTDYTLASNTCAAGKVCGHYTQMVWAASTRIGCGMAKCDALSVSGSTWANGYFLVCDYAPPGNYVGQKPYVTTGATLAPTTQAPTTQAPTTSPAPGGNTSGCFTVAQDATKKCSVKNTCAAAAKGSLKCKVGNTTWTATSWTLTTGQAYTYDRVCDSCSL